MGRYDNGNGRKRKPSENGGLGGDALSRTEIHALTRWPHIARGDVVKRVHDMLPHAETPRELAGLVRCLVAMEGQNQADEHMAVKLANGVTDGELRVRVVYEQRHLPTGDDDD